MSARYHDAFTAALLDAQSVRDPAVDALAHQPGFAVYRNTFMKAGIDALQANFPAVTRLTGEDWFRSAAAQFVRAHPPGHPSLLEYGADFPAFLRGCEAASGLPWLADVAQLDRLWTEAHSAEDAPCLEAAHLAALTREWGDDIGDLVLPPHPAARWAWSAEHPAYEIWSANRSGRQAESVHWTGQGTLLTRPDGEVLWQALDEAGWLLLEECRTGRELGAVAEEVLAAWPDTDFMALLASLIAAGAFTLPADALTPAQGNDEEESA